MALIASSRRRKLRRPLSLGEVGWSPSTSSKSLASAPSQGIRTSRQLSLSPAATTSTELIYHRYSGNGTIDFEQAQSLSPSRRRARGRSTSPKPHIFEEGHLPTAYASLPPSPVQRPRSFTPPAPISPIPQRYAQPQVFQPGAPFSLWDYLREELLATDFDSHQELKWERVRNFLNMPLAMEKVSIFSPVFMPHTHKSDAKIIGFGFILCFDSFLYTFTILPIRFVLALSRFVSNIFRRSPPPLPPSQKADLLRALLLVISLLILNPLTDASKIYHLIRGQDTIKLYVIFNALEVRRRFSKFHRNSRFNRRLAIDFVLPLGKTF